MTVMGDRVPVCEPDGLFDDVQLTRYEVIALPLGGAAVNWTLNGPVELVVEPGMASTWVGAPGWPAMNDCDAADAALVPTPFVAVARHV